MASQTLRSETVSLSLAEMISVGRDRRSEEVSSMKFQLKEMVNAGTKDSRQTSDTNC